MKKGERVISIRKRGKEMECMICGETMPEKSYCLNFHKELEVLWDGYEPDNKKKVSGFKDPAGKGKASKGKELQVANNQEVLPELRKDGNVQAEPNIRA